MKILQNVQIKEGLTVSLWIKKCHVYTLNHLKQYSIVYSFLGWLFVPRFCSLNFRVCGGKWICQRLIPTSLGFIPHQLVVQKFFNYYSDPFGSEKCFVVKMRLFRFSKNPNWIRALYGNDNIIIKLEIYSSILFEVGRESEY